jgi:CcmD family protein
VPAVLAEIPALPLHTAGKYVAGAYIVLFLLVLVYVAIMASRLSRIERELGELLELVPPPEAPPAPPEIDLEGDGGSAVERDSVGDATSEAPARR